MKTAQKSPYPVSFPSGLETPAGQGPSFIIQCKAWHVQGSQKCELNEPVSESRCSEIYRCGRNTKEGTRDPDLGNT